MSDPPTAPVTRLLHAWRQGNEQAMEELLPLVYDELRRLAGRYMRSEKDGHTLQTTALVHEAYVRLVDMDVPWTDRVHFFSLAARLMRRILVDHAKTNRRKKRGGAAHKISLDDVAVVSDQPGGDLVELDRALDKLAQQDSRKSQAVELHYFGGLTYEEMAEAMQVSPATVHRELRMAKAWLYHELRQSE